MGIRYEVGSRREEVRDTRYEVGGLFEEGLVRGNLLPFTFYLLPLTLYFFVFYKFNE